MLLSEDTSELKYKITSYEPGTLQVNETDYHHSLVLGLNKMITPWEPRTLNELTDQHLLQILTLNPDIVLLGTGKQFILPPAKQLKVLHQNQISVECMDTRAACSTYLILASEGRNVATGLLIE